MGRPSLIADPTLVQLVGAWVDEGRGTGAIRDGLAGLRPPLVVSEDTVRRFVKRWRAEAAARESLHAEVRAAQAMVDAGGDPAAGAWPPPVDWFTTWERRAVYDDAGRVGGVWVRRVQLWGRMVWVADRPERGMPIGREPRVLCEPGCLRLHTVRELAEPERSCLLSRGWFGMPVGWTAGADGWRVSERRR